MLIVLYVVNGRDDRFWSTSAGLMPTSPNSLTSPGLPDLGIFSLPPRADIILRSCDAHDFPLQKLYVIDSSPVLGGQILAATSHGPEPERKPFSPSNSPFKKG